MSEGISISASAPSEEEKQKPSSQESPSYIAPGATPVFFSSYALPASPAVAKESQIPFGFLFSPTLPLDPAPPVVPAKPSHRCSYCGSWANSYCSVSSLHLPGRRGSWTCCFCGKDNVLLPPQQPASSPELAARDELPIEQLPEFTSKIVDFQYDSCWSSAFTVAGKMQQHALLNYIFVIDRNMPKAAWLRVREACLTALTSLASLPDQTVRVGLITYGATVSLYDLSHQSAASCFVVPGPHLSPLRI